MIRRFISGQFLPLFSKFSLKDLPMTYCNRVQRFIVPQEKRSWEVEWPQYTPVPFQLDFNDKPWADPDIREESFKWNQLDGNIDRRSHSHTYAVLNGFPLNPLGRTGICLRGLLGRWGPNHAADPIVTRWKRDSNKQVVTHPSTDRPILQFVAIKRKDTNEWALPGGMVDAGEEISQTIKREFFEEALNSLEANQQKTNEMNQKLSQFFSSGEEIYRGCVDDPRNTDNAWMETIAVNFHDSTGDTIGDIELTAGDDAIGVKWVDINSSLELYANHLDFIEKTSKRLSSHY